MNWKLTELMSRDRYLYIDLNEKENLSEIQSTTDAVEKITMRYISKISNNNSS